MAKVCDDCGRPNRRGGRVCSACYQRAYRADPEIRRRHIERVVDYTARHPEKRRHWVQAYQIRVGIRVPDLQELRRSIKRLERSLVETKDRSGLREPGQ